MTPLTEIIIFPPFRRGEEVTQESFNIFNKADGLLRAFRGFQVEEPTIRYWVLEWQSSGHQRAFVANAAHKPHIETLRANLAEAQVIRVHSPCPVAAFSAPVTELTTGTWLAGVEKSSAFAALQLTLGEENAHRQQHGAGSGAVSRPWLRTVEHTDVFVFARGWESVEAHDTAMATPVGGVELREMGALSNFVIRHVLLECYEHRGQTNGSVEHESEESEKL